MNRARKLTKEIETVTKNPVISGLLESISGVLAVLNENREIIAVNHSLLKMLDIDNPEEILGLKPGKAMHCVHAESEGLDCGETKFCSTCGAAIAIVTSLIQDKPVERICALSANGKKGKVDLVLNVKSHPLLIESKKYVLLFLQDITRDYQRASLERTFFHDINNMLGVLIGVMDLMMLKYPHELTKSAYDATLRIQKEIEIQRCLSQSHSSEYNTISRLISLDEIVADLKDFFKRHPIARDKHIAFQEPLPEISLNTDSSLVSRVLCNMILNALEATENSGFIKVWFDVDEKNLICNVWNNKKFLLKYACGFFKSILVLKSSQEEVSVHFR